VPGARVLARYDWAGVSYYLLASPAGTRVITSRAGLPICDAPPAGAAPQSQDPRPGGDRQRNQDAAALLAREIAGQMFRAPLDARLAWAAVGRTQIILLADGGHAHLAERGPGSIGARRYPIGQALRAWHDRVGQHVSRAGGTSG
jgi:hypothetical protein